ncbi:MAG: hypothetical protein NBV68_04440 [Erythrobacter sp.]|uniref:hypothetical protein n=1 Tax=Erythrobacter sp. TaxID=1042 RepID=UPI0025E53C86|nr:hypothetical protein [Erythrobacter sp.]MCL9998606.1 hypothetical protein [Erythrobacter sp.]
MRMQVGRSVLLGLVAVIALLMAGNAALWLLVPERAAEALKMPLLTGPALSSQMDIGAFFLAAACFIGLALITRERPWFIAAAVPLLGAAAYRTAAFLFHGAPFLADMVGIEISMGAILIIASRVLGRERGSNG